MIIDRRVQLLRIRASSDERARHAAVLLDDALRTATVPGTSGARMVLIRKLEVTMVPGAATVAGATLAVEVAARRLAASAVHGESSHAGDALAVYFRDDAEALVALARRIASGRPSTEWFWPLIVRGWSSSDATDVAAAVLVDRALATETAAAATAQVVAAFVALGASNLLLAPLTPARGIALLSASGWSAMNVPASDAARPASVAPQMPTATRAVISEWMARWGGPSDPRAAWLAGMLLVAERPARATSAALPGAVEALLSALAVTERRTERGVVAVRTSEVRRKESSDEKTLMVDERAWRELAGESGVAPVTGEPRVASAQAILEPDGPLSPITLEDVDRSWHAPRRTAHAGLLFLVPLFSRLGIAEMLADRTDLAERDWAEGVLLRFGRRLGISADDAALGWLRPERLEVTAANRAASAAWMRATRTRTRRDTGRTTTQLICRTGAIAATRTHIDVVFLHAQVDVAIRRAGLDIDPGWVPWLGRVIRFHYVDAISDGI